MNKKFLAVTMVLVLGVGLAKIVAREDQGDSFGSEESLSIMGVSNTLVEEVK